MKVISTTQDLKSAVNEFAAHDFVAVDTEFMRESTYWPRLCLIQAAAPGIEVIIDPLAESLDLEPFLELLANERIVKVFHAARQDIEIFFVRTGLVPTPVFDTQVAAMVCGFGESIGYVNLVKHVTGADIDKSSRFTDWSKRPLSKKQLTYALGDVTHLRDIYRFLLEQLAKRDRTAWLTEEMAVLIDPQTYASTPEDAWQRLKSRVKNRKALAVLMELAAWRERAAQGRDVPRGRVLRDEAIYDIANQMPDAVEKLSGLRSLSEGFARSQNAREIVEAVRRGLARDQATVPQIKRGRPLTPQATATLELLKVLLKSAAAKNDVAPRLIADASDLEKIATQDEPTAVAMRGWRRKLFGEDALRLKRGELALTLVDGEVQLVPTKAAQ